jgi:hypothetical protein
MSGKSIWLIEQGEYSDYSVRGVFSTKENAERIAALFAGGYDTPSVNEWTLDPGVEETLKGWKQYNLTILRDGTVERCEPGRSYLNLADHEWLWERTKAPAYQGKGIPDALQLTVWAADEVHAVKVANERRVQWIATGKFPHPELGGARPEEGNP